MMRKPGGGDERGGVELDEEGEFGALELGRGVTIVSVFKIFVSLVVLSAPAFAGTVHGDKATGLTQGLRYAGIKPATANRTRTFRASAIECVRMLEGDATLGNHECTVDKSVIKDAGAYVLYTAMIESGLPETPDTATHIKVTASHVACTIDAASNVQCSWDGGGGESSVRITPKKHLPKDLVQPVKIEKQP